MSPLKEWLKSVVKRPSNRSKSRPSSSQASSACGSTSSFTDPAVSQSSKADVNTDAAQANTANINVTETPGAQEPSDSSERQLFVVPQITVSGPENNGTTSDKTAKIPTDASPLDEQLPQPEETAEAKCLSNVANLAPEYFGAGGKGTPSTQLVPEASTGPAGANTPTASEQVVHLPATSTSTNTGGVSPIASEQQPQKTVNTLSLWEVAWKKLPEDVRNHFQSTLDETDNKGSRAAEQLLTVIKEIRGTCEKQKLIDTIDDGKKSRRIIVRDLADKLINWVSKFVAVGDILVQYDPGHAAIPWAMVRFILQSAIVHRERMAEIVTNTEYLGNLIVRCVAYEELYLGESKPRNYSSLKLAVEKLYLEILKFLVETAKHLNRTKLGSVLRAILEPEAIREILQGIKSHEQQLAAELELAQRNVAQTNFAVTQSVAEHNHKQLTQLLDDLEKPIQRVVSDLQACYQSVQAKTRKNVLNWITNTEYEAPHHLALQGLLEDTGKWFFDRTEYKEWRSASASSMLWLHGIPGAGKTKLTCQVIKELHSTNPNEVLCFFYCKRDGEASRRIPLTVLQAIIKQLSLRQPDGLPNEILNRYMVDQKNGFPAGKSGVLRWEDCGTLLLSLLNMYPQTTIIIDALDELDLDYESKHRHLLLELLNDVILKCESLVKIFVASRDDQDIVMEFKKVPNLFIKATDNLKDIERYIIREFETDRRFTRPPWSPALKNTVYAVLCDKANGMFQWVKLQLQFLVSMKVEEDIRQKLGKAPKGLMAAYDQIYSLIEDEEEYGREAAKCALMWVMCTVMPLTMEMLLEATRYAIGSQDIISAEVLLELCRNLLTWDKSEKSNVVQFAHLSVKEYLIGEKWTEAEAHAIAAKSCLTVLISENGLPRPGYRITTLLEYADSYWLDHVSEGSAGPSRQTFKPLCVFLGSPALPSPSYGNWIRGRQLFGVPTRPQFSLAPNARIEEKLDKVYCSTPPNPIFLVAACDFLLEFTDESWPQWECFDLHSRNDRGDTLFYIAARNGNNAVATRLLTHDVVDLNVKSSFGDNPLLAAAYWGH
ncbi:hypothetical protein L211DRAFT_462101, partial [Terfezia boudieri ATCC MYA-4762]